MNILLLFFALPIATIILASVLETILCCPIKVTSVFFAIYLVITFWAFDETFLIFAIVYTILAYISAVITRFVLKLTQYRKINKDIIMTSNNTTLNTTIDTQNFENNIGDNFDKSNCVRNCRFRRF